MTELIQLCCFQSVCLWSFLCDLLDMCSFEYLWTFGWSLLSFKPLLSFCFLLLLSLLLVVFSFELSFILFPVLVCWYVWSEISIILLRWSLNCSQDGEALSTYQDIIYLDFLQLCFEMAYWSNDVMCCSFHIWVLLIAEYSVVFKFCCHRSRVNTALVHLEAVYSDLVLSQNYKFFIFSVGCFDCLHSYVPFIHTRNDTLLGVACMRDSGITSGE